MMPLILKCASIAAHDLGGMADLSFAVRHQGHLEKFIIMDTSPYSKWPFMLHSFLSRTFRMV